MKPNTAVQRRIKVTRNGKIKVRHPKQNHYNAKESRAYQISTKRGYDSGSWLARYDVIKRFLG